MEERLMITSLNHVTVLVKDQDEALKFYTEKLGLEKRADEAFGEGMRWLTVAPTGQTNLEIVLNPAFSPDAESKIGKLTGWVFHTDDCRKEYETLQARGVTFTEAPTEQMWGIQAQFEDLYGNQFVLLQASG
jgi:predicted enzyme related to lactoylglutathione lyase